MSYEYNGRPVHQTLAFKQFKPRTEKIVEFAVKEKLSGEPNLLPVNINSKLIRGVSRDVVAKLAPSFTYPIFISKEHGVLLDARNLRRNDGSIGNTQEAGNQVIEAVLEYYWCTDISRFKGVTDVTSVIFGSWITSAFRTRLGVDEVAQLNIRMLFTIYYWLRFLSPIEYAALERDEIEAVAFKLFTTQLKIAPVNSEMLFDNPAFKNIIDHVVAWKESEFDSGLLDMVCAAIPEIAPTTSLREFSTRDLLDAVIGRAWVGPRANEMTIACLEHPPTLMAMVAIAEIQKSFYQKSTMGMVVKNLKAMRISGGDITKLVKDSILDIEEYQDGKRDW